MPPTATPPTADTLLAHADWICARARSLGRDPDAADEVARPADLEHLVDPGYS